MKAPIEATAHACAIKKVRTNFMLGSHLHAVPGQRTTPPTGAILNCRDVSRSHCTDDQSRLSGGSEALQLAVRHRAVSCLRELGDGGGGSPVDGPDFDVDRMDEVIESAVRGPQPGDVRQAFDLPVTSPCPAIVLRGDASATRRDDRPYAAASVAAPARTGPRGAVH